MANALAFAVGIGSLGLQFVYNRIIFFYVANSEYVAASIIALHLTGFLLGSLLGRRLTCPAAALLWGALASTALSFVLVWMVGFEVFGLLAVLALATLFSLLNAALAGAVLVLLMRRHADQADAAPTIFIADSVGSALGAVSFGFGIIPHWGIEAGFVIAMAVQLGAVAAAASAARLATLAAVSTLIVCGAYGVAPWVASQRGEAGGSHLRAHGLPLLLGDKNLSDLLVSEWSPFGVVSVIEAKDKSTVPYRWLSIDSRTLCSAGERQSNMAFSSEWGIGAQAVQWVAETEQPRIAVVGLGCGITLSSILHEGTPTTRVTTIEINPKMRKATEQFEALLEFDLDDDRHQLVIDDGFKFFAGGSKEAHFHTAIIDVAWMQNMNATHLFSKEMFDHVRKSLTNDGLLIVWSEESHPFSDVSKIIYATLRRSFDYVVVDQHGDGAIVFYATTKAGAMRLNHMMDDEAENLTQWIVFEAQNSPINTLDNLVMNRSKFTWFGDSTFDRLFDRYGSQ